MVMVKITFMMRVLLMLSLLFILPDQAVTAWGPESLPSHHHYDILMSLIRSVGWNPRNVDVQHLDKEKSAFCNTVYRVNQNKDTTIAIAKIFSPLALARMTHRPVGSMDSYVASQGLAPRILAKTNESILMEFYEHNCDGTQNAEERDDSLCALSLAQLHSLLPLSPSQENDENMLWRSCRILLLHHVSESWACHGVAGGGSWNKEMLATEVRNQQARLSQKSLIEVPIAHGDCKPSNVIHQRERVVFIDLELCGRNYRAFDLAKLLRNDQDPALRNSSSRRARFLSAYAQHVDVSLHQLQTEVDEILSLTWLEAAIFFAAMESVDPPNSKNWNSLAASRLQNYEMCRNLTQ